MTSAKKAIRKIIPVRASVFEKYREDQRKHNQEMSKRLEDIARQNAELQEMLNLIRSDIGQIGNGVGQARDAIRRVRDEAVSIRKDVNTVGNISREANWANVFHDTIISSSWFSDTPLSPGRWAVGYQYLYALYRVLDSFKPCSILEFGLGESTTVINAYAKAYEDIIHTVIEHDPTWIEFYTSKNDVSGCTDIVQCDLGFTRLSDVSHEIRVYQDSVQKLQETYPERKYDFISIDGPFGYDMPEVARVDTLSLIPDMLAKSFVIMLDDYNRSGEKGTVNLMRGHLENASIEYEVGEYRGEKTTCIITSKDLSFLTSL